MSEGASHPLDPLQAVAVPAHRDPLFTQREGPETQGQAGSLPTLISTVQSLNLCNFLPPILFLFEAVLAPGSVLVLSLACR